MTTPDSSHANDPKGRDNEGLRDDASNDSTWGIGSATALEIMKRHEERRAREKLPPALDERPSGK